MLIGIDASRATKSQRRGPEQYSFYLIKALAKIDRKNQYLLYSPLAPKGELANLPANFKWKILPFPRFWTQIRLSWEMLLNPIPFLFVPSHVLPIIHPKKTLLTVHDLVYKYHPKVYSFFTRSYENFSLKYLVKKASWIIVPSKATRADLLKFTDLEPKKIIVIYHGYDSTLYHPAEKRKINFPYIFYLGGLTAKKNVKGLIEAFGEFKKEARFKSYKLILAGQPGYQYQKIKETIAQMPKEIQGDIKELGYLKDEEAASWMRNANVFVLPSFIEGFGIPVIEAMASGVPVVASKTPALCEVAKDAAIFADPKNPTEMARAIKKVFENAHLGEELIEKGLQRAKEFSWEKCAEQTLKVLEEVGKSD